MRVSVVEIIFHGSGRLLNFYAVRQVQQAPVNRVYRTSGTTGVVLSRMLFTRDLNASSDFSLIGVIQRVLSLND